MEQELIRANKKFWSEQNNSRISDQRKIYDYYTGDEQRILGYLRAAMNLTFDPQDVAEFQLDWINITQKIIDNISVVYKAQANRIILGSKGKKNDELTNLFNSKILPGNVNSFDKMAHRFAKCFNTSLTRVKVVNGKLFYEVLPSNLYDVKIDDNNPYKITEISYDKYLTNPNGEIELWTFFWTDKKHYRKQVLQMGDKQVHGDEYPVGKNSRGMDNPYGVIPFAVLRIKETGDFWGNTQMDIVKANEQINLLLTDLTNGGIIMQSWGIPVLINTGDGKKVNKLRMGPKHPITIEEVSADLKPDAKFIHGTPMIKDIKDVIDWKIKLIALTKGLNPNSFLAEVKAASGFSKVMDALEEIEMRRDDIEPCREYEDRRFEITKAVVNWHSKNDPLAKDLPEIPGDSYLQVQFGDFAMPKSSDEIIRENEFELETGLTSILDLARKKNPDLEDAELEAMIKKNLETNRRIGLTSQNMISDTARATEPDEGR